MLNGKMLVIGTNNTKPQITAHWLSVLSSKCSPWLEGQAAHPKQLGSIDWACLLTSTVQWKLSCPQGYGSSQTIESSLWLQWHCHL